MQTKNFSLKTIFSDLSSGFVVFLVAIPLCLGVCIASDAPLFSGILAGVIGGIVVGMFSGSSTSVSGPAAGLIAVVASQIQLLGSFEAFLTAVVLAGVIQIIFGVSRMGFLGAFFPSSVIKGLLCAIGLILILKQIPVVFGFETLSLGNDAAIPASSSHTFSEIISNTFDFHIGTAFIGLTSLFLLIAWDKISFLKNLPIPSPVVVIAFSILFTYFLQYQGEYLALHDRHFVNVPLASTLQESLDHLMFPNFSILNNSAVYSAAVTIAIIASLETLINIEALDRLDPLQRVSPPNRELVAQGMGNIVGGLIGALPITSVIVRSSVNIAMGAKTKLSTIFHGFFILASVLFVAEWLNMIPLSALAAILVTTGLKLASPKIFKQMWQQGKNQLLPFLATVIAIILTDLLIGVVIGLIVATFFILQSNIRSPFKTTLEKHPTGDQVLHIVLPNQVSFFNRASLENTLKSIPEGGHVLIDASNTHYIDPDILSLISDFETKTGKVRKVTTSLLGFKEKYPQLEDHIEYVEVSSKALQASLTPLRVLEILREGNARFRKNIHLTRNLSRQLHVTSSGQFPMATVLSCIDSRSPVELIFDLGLGDIFSVRIAGNVVSPKILGSIEYSCAIAGAKLILVMGHTSCGAVKASVDFAHNKKNVAETTGCAHLNSLLEEIQKSINMDECNNIKQLSRAREEEYCNDISYKNVIRSMQEIRQRSPTLNQLIEEGKIDIIGAMYNISTAEVSFFQESGCATFSSQPNFSNNLLKKMIRKFVSRYPLLKKFTN